MRSAHFKLRRGQERLSRKKAGEAIALKVLREGRVVELSGAKP
ncbi:MAG TPA: hypothetical protein VNQ15_12030 [Verrucomicrobiae bacterium]|jgi:hypothetical protein|nr:hypothetical protein [Methylomirabilota bacterium]HWN92139.1 hypothetical protein [Verrucomicrobiae bacterium]